MTIAELKKELEQFDDNQELKIVGQSSIEWIIDNIKTFDNSEVVRIKLK